MGQEILLLNDDENGFSANLGRGRGWVQGGRGRG